MLSMLAMFMVVACCCFVAAAWDRLHGRARYLRYVPALLLIVGLLAIPNRFIAQKCFARLIMPVGLLWLVMFGGVLRLLYARRRAAWLAMALWLGFWLFGSDYVGTAGLRMLESDFRSASPGGPYEAVIILGGGTSARPSGAPQVSHSGDRVVEAARLYRRGKIGTIICSGVSVAGLNQASARDLSGETRTILMELGVPDSAIVVLPGALNTSQEIAAFAQLVRDEGWTRVGIITSAWHMRRAQRLAQRNELDATPLPADFRGGETVANVVDVFPSGNGFYRTRLVAWEVIGAMVGR